MAELPDKLYYSIREVAEHTGVEPHVLRYWESEFPSLKPKRARSGARNYRKRDIEEILVIKRLLHEEGYRIEGARKHLLELKRQKSTSPTARKRQASLFASQSPEERLGQVRKELGEIMDLIREMKPE